MQLRVCPEQVPGHARMVPAQAQGAQAQGLDPVAPPQLSQAQVPEQDPEAPELVRAAFASGHADTRHTSSF